ncbi:MAG: hypothetical protein WEB00_12010 [Dehalococcoidia bacterium]
MGTRLALIAVALGCLALGGCLGGDDDETPGSSPTPSASSPTQSASPTYASTAPPGYLGQDSYAICVDNPSGEFDNAEIEDAVRDAVAYGQTKFWQHTYLESFPLDVSQGCPLAPRKGSDLAKRSDQLSSPYSVFVFALTDREWERFGYGDGIPLTTIEFASTDYESDDPDGFISYATYLRRSDLDRTQALAIALGGAWGRPPGQEGASPGECEGPSGDFSAMNCHEYFGSREREQPRHGFVEVTLPDSIAAGCDPPWRAVEFDAASLCMPAEWQVANSPVLIWPGVDNLVLYPDGSWDGCGIEACPSLMLTIQGGPLRPPHGLRMCPDPVFLDGLSGRARVCGRVDPAKAGNIQYGLVFDNLRYVQIDLIAGRGEPFLNDAWRVAARIFELAAVPPASSALEAIDAYLAGDVRAWVCEDPNPPPDATSLCVAPLGGGDGEEAFLVDAAGGTLPLAVYFTREANGGFVVDRREALPCRNSPFCPIPAGAAVNLVGEDCIEVREQPTADAAARECVAPGATTKVVGPARAADGRIWLQTELGWVSAVNARCLERCVPVDFDQAPDFLVWPYRNWGPAIQ